MIDRKLIFPLLIVLMILPASWQNLHSRGKGNVAILIRWEILLQQIQYYRMSGWEGALQRLIELEQTLP